MERETLFKKANQLKRKGKLDEAIAIYSQLINSHPKLARGYYQLGEIFAKQGKLDEAIAQYEQAIALNPNLAWCHYHLGEILVSQGDFITSMLHLQKAIDLKPDEEKFDYYWQCISDSTKNYNEIIKLQEKLLDQLKALNITKILLTNHHLEIYAGSELVTFYLAKLFSDLGLDVTIASFVTGEPMMSTITSQNIEVINVINDPLKIKKRKFDLVWCHHFPVIDYCVNDLRVDTNFMVYSSLSGYSPLEKITYLDTSDLIIFNSQENKRIQTFGLDNKYQDKIVIFNNSLPREWFVNHNLLYQDKINQSVPKNIAVISNHVPPELKKLPDLLKEHEITVNFIGKENKQELVTPTLIDNFDAVITIGHTVQKAMSRKIPVYCYDRFGGPGWITKDNLLDAEYFNFSGRCCHRKLNAENIKAEILNGYSTTIKNLNDLFHYSQLAYSIEANVYNVLGKIKLSDRSFLERLHNYPFESYQTRKITQLYVYNKFKVGSSKTIVYFNRKDNELSFIKK